MLDWLSTLPPEKVLLLSVVLGFCFMVLTFLALERATRPERYRGRRRHEEKTTPNRVASHGRNW